MSDETTPPPDAFAPVDPYALARREAATTQIKRFYKDVAVAEDADGFAVLLDGRPARTPARSPVLLPTREAASRVAAEWERQGEALRLDDMPTIKLVNTILDGVTRTMSEVRAEIVKYAGTDLLCYRADAPDELVASQAQAWDPVVTWVREELRAGLYLAEGVMFVAQSPEALEAIDAAVERVMGGGRAAPFRLGALHVLTTLTGSALLALGVGHGRLTAEEAWTKAHVDEDFQISRWGQDAEAEERRERRWREAEAASRLIDAVPATRS